VSHIGAKEEVTEKRGSVGPTRPRENNRPQPMRVHEDTTEKRSSVRHAPYEPKRHQTKTRVRGGVPSRHKFRVNLKELITIPDVVDKLKPPPKTDKRLGSSKDRWCEFHQAFGHGLRNCLALRHQLTELVRDGFLKEYLEENQEAPMVVAPVGDQGHEVPVYGEVNTIFRGFSGGGCTASQRKKYAREVLAVEAWEPDQSP